MKKWLHTFASIAATLAVVTVPQLQAVISAHPKFTVALGAAHAVLGHLLNSPLSTDTRH